MEITTKAVLMRLLRYFVAFMVVGIMAMLPSLHFESIYGLAFISFLGGVIGALGKYIRMRWGFDWLFF